MLRVKNILRDFLIGFLVLGTFASFLVLLGWSLATRPEMCVMVLVLFSVYLFGRSIGQSIRQALDEDDPCPENITDSYLGDLI